MNRAFFIVLVPPLLAAMGYAIVLHSLGIPTGTMRVLVAAVLFFGGIWWIGRQSRRRARANSLQ